MGLKYFQQLYDFGNEIDKLFWDFQTKVQAEIEKFQTGRLHLYGVSYTPAEFIRDVMKLYVNVWKMYTGRSFWTLNDSGKRYLAEKLNNAMLFLKKIKGLSVPEASPEVFAWIAANSAKPGEPDPD